MIAVIFEVIPRGDHKDEYFKLAADLKPSLEKIEGFISIERFQSLNDAQKILSLSFWKDEESIRQWRSMDMHRSAQKEGRSSIFENYRLRIAGVIRDYGMFDRDQAPTDSKIFHDEQPG